MKYTGSVNLSKVAQVLASIYKPTGNNEGVAIAPVSLVAGDTISLKFIAPETYTGDFRTFVSGDGMRLYTTSHNMISLLRMDITIDGVEYVTDDVMPTDGREHLMVITMNDAATMTHIHCLPNERWNSNFPIYDVEINAQSGDRKYLFNDGMRPDGLILDEMNPLGSKPELWNHPTYVSTGDEGIFQFLHRDLSVLEIGKAYSGSMTVTNCTEGEFSLRLGEAVDVVRVAGTGSGTNTTYFRGLVAAGKTLDTLIRTPQVNAGAQLTVNIQEDTHGRSINFKPEGWIGGFGI